MDYQYAVSCRAVHVEEITLPPHSTLYASLDDVSQQPPKVVATCIIPDVKRLGLPVQAMGLSFGLTLAKSHYTEGHKYVVNARIETAGEVRFISKEPVTVDPTANYVRAIDVELVLVD